MEAAAISDSPVPPGGGDESLPGDEGPSSESCSPEKGGGGDGDGTSKKSATFKNVLQAKKRLQAYSPLVKKPPKMEQLSDGERRAQPSPPCPEQKKPCKPSNNPAAKAKKLIEELEEIKRAEQAHMEALRLTAEGVERRSRSHDKERFKKVDKRDRNYRRRSPTPEKSRRSSGSHQRGRGSSSEHQRSSNHHRKEKETVSVAKKYPRNWKEFKEHSFTFSVNKEFDVPAAKGNNELLRTVLFDLPPLPISSMKIKTVDEKEKTVPFEYIRYTRAKPSVPYSVNCTAIKFRHLPRKEVLDVIPKEQFHTMEKLYSNSQKFKDETRLAKSIRHWYNRSWCDNVSSTECKLLENSIGLSFLQSYTDEDYEVVEEESIARTPERLNESASSTSNSVKKNRPLIESSPPPPTPHAKSEKAGKVDREERRSSKSRRRSEIEEEEREREREARETARLRKRDEEEREMARLRRREEEEEREMVRLRRRQEEEEREMMRLRKREEEEQREMARLRKREEEEQREIVRLRKRQEEEQREMARRKKEEEEAAARKREEEELLLLAEREIKEKKESKSKKKKKALEKEERDKKSKKKKKKKRKESDEDEEEEEERNKKKKKRKKVKVKKEKRAKEKKKAKLLLQQQVCEEVLEELKEKGKKPGSEKRKDRKRKGSSDRQRDEDVKRIKHSRKEESKRLRHVLKVEERKPKGGTPDTDEYHSHWESDEEVSNSAMRQQQQQKLNRSWESDEEMFDRTYNKAMDTLNSYEELEIPLNLNIKAPRSRSKLHRFDAESEIRLLEEERRNLSEERRKLEMEKEKLQMMQKEVQQQSSTPEYFDLNKVKQEVLDAVNAEPFPQMALETEYEEFIKAVSSGSPCPDETNEITTHSSSSDSEDSSSSSDSDDSTRKSKKRKSKDKRPKEKKKRKLQAGTVLNDRFNEFDIPVPSEIPEISPPLPPPQPSATVVSEMVMGVSVVPSPVVSIPLPVPSPKFVPGAGGIVPGEIFPPLPPEVTVPVVVEPVPMPAKPFVFNSMTLSSKRPVLVNQVNLDDGSDSGVDFTDMFKKSSDAAAAAAEKQQQQEEGRQTDGELAGIIPDRAPKIEPVELAELVSARLDDDGASLHTPVKSENVPTAFSISDIPTPEATLNVPKVLTTPSKSDGDKSAEKEELSGSGNRSFSEHRRSGGDSDRKRNEDEKRRNDRDSMGGNSNSRRRSRSRDRGSCSRRLSPPRSRRSILSPPRRQRLSPRRRSPPPDRRRLRGGRRFRSRSPRRSLSPLPRRGGGGSSSFRKRTPSPTTRLPRRQGGSSPLNSPLDGFKRSVADSTISDDLLPQPAIDDYSNSPPSSSFNSSSGRKYRRSSLSPTLSPKRMPLDDRISQVLGLDKCNEPPPPLPPPPLPQQSTPQKNLKDVYYGYPPHPHGATSTPYDAQHGQQYVVPHQYGGPPPQYHGQFSTPPPPPVPQKVVVPGVDEYRRYGYDMPPPKLPAPTKVVQVGNILQVVPNEDLPTVIMQNKVQETPQKIVQVGNMLQIVPAVMPVMGPSPKLEPPFLEATPPEEVLQSPAIVTAEKQSAEALMKLKNAERKAEREKRRQERERRRKEKERKQKEREKRKQLKMKLKTENMIKRALQMETDMTNEGDEGEEEVHWPPAPVVVSNLTPSGTPTKGILITGGFSKLERKLKTPEQRKSVQFADGVRPGEGTSPSGGEELSSPPPSTPQLPKEKRFTKVKVPKKPKKKKIKVKVIKKSAPSGGDDEDDDEEEDDNLPPPSPPPGSPPPHVFPSRVKTHTINNVHQHHQYVSTHNPGFAVAAYRAPPPPQIPQMVINRGPPHQHAPPPAYLPPAYQEVRGLPPPDHYPVGPIQNHH